MVANNNGIPSLALADESSAGPFMTGGIFCIPSGRADDAAFALRNIKAERGVEPEAEIHCRVLFHDRARSKSPFAKLSLDNCHDMLEKCVSTTSTIGASWWGGWVNKDAYPTELQLVEGERFAVTDKHLKGLAVVAALKAMEHLSGFDYRLAFDADRTKIDWGLASRVQATHFSRTHPHAIDLANAHKPLLELADIAAYTAAQCLYIDYRPDSIKPHQRRFTSLLRLMQLRTASLAYTPWLRPIAG
jgi:hypothetical protein